MSQEHDEGYTQGYNDAINEVLKILQEDLIWYKKAATIDAHIIGKSIVVSYLNKIKELKL